MAESSPGNECGPHQPPAAEHAWLQRLVGEWTFESSCNMGPDQPPQTFRGSESVKAFGDYWIVCDGQSEMPGGGSGYMRMTLGFDPAKKKFVGTWIGTMMANLWVYDISMDADQKVLTMAAEGPAMTGEGTANYRDVITIVSENERTLTSFMHLPDGSWTQFMTGVYRRK